MTKVLNCTFLIFVSLYNLYSSDAPLNENDLLFANLNTLDSTIVDSIQVDTLKGSVFDELYKDNTILQVEIKTDFDLLFELKKSNEFLPAKIRYKNKEGHFVDRKMKLRARGKTRRRVCDFPPLQIKFKKKDLRKDSLAEFNQLKLVTHCFDNEEYDHGQTLFKEFLAYRLYNLTTTQSFRVQLLKVDYVDTNDDKKRISRFGFLIEPNDEIAARLGGTIHSNYYNCPPSEINEANYLQFSTFQYMIGNADWKLSFIHNLKLIITNDSTQKFIVPYDFDFSGLVDAAYAKPNPDLNQKKVTDRFFMGEHQNDKAIQLTLDNMVAQKKTLIDYCKSFALIKKKERRKVVKYLNSFFSLVKNKEKRKEIFYKEESKDSKGS